LAAVARAGVVGAFVVVLLSLLVYDAARTIAAFSAACASRSTWTPCRPSYSP
jgi:hypothetical protein